VLASPAMLRAGLLIVVAACSTPGSPPQDPADGATSAQPVETASASATASEPESTATAIGPTGEIINHPPASGVVMDNATPPGSNAAPTRLQPIIDVMVTNKDKYRACLDGWGKSNPGRELKVTLSIQLDKEGGLTGSAFKADETDVVDKPMEACMADVAKSLKFPASPNGQPTRYNHRFVFKAKKS
jgi:hypothetical protein